MTTAASMLKQVASAPTFLRVGIFVVMILLAAFCVLRHFALAIEYSDTVAWAKDPAMLRAAMVWFYCFTGIELLSLVLGTSIIRFRFANWHPMFGWLTRVAASAALTAGGTIGAFALMFYCVQKVGSF